MVVIGVGEIGDVVQVISDRATAGCAATRPDRQEAMGIRHEPEGLRVAEDPQ